MHLRIVEALLFAASEPLDEAALRQQDARHREVVVQGVEARLRSQ